MFLNPCDFNLDFVSFVKHVLATDVKALRAMKSCSMQFDTDSQTFERSIFSQSNVATPVFVSALWLGVLTTAAKSRSLRLDFAGIMRRIHFDPEGRHWNSLNANRKTNITINPESWKQSAFQLI